MILPPIKVLAPRKYGSGARMPTPDEIERVECLLRQMDWNAFWERVRARSKPELDALYKAGARSYISMRTSPRVFLG